LLQKQILQEVIGRARTTVLPILPILPTLPRRADFCPSKTPVVALNDQFNTYWRARMNSGQGVHKPLLFALWD
jgi:hypothetical protein